MITLLFSKLCVEIPCRRSLMVVTIFLMLSELDVLACLPRKKGFAARKQS
jgi:hypothetical protein